MGKVWKWGKGSLVHRARLHPVLQAVFDEVLNLTPFDVSITDSFRGEKLQTEAFASGASQVEWPNSMHNQNPSIAGHLDPVPIDYDRTLRYYVLAGVVMAAARRLGMEDRVRWGGKWDRDWRGGLEMNPFKDLSHYEIRDKA